MDDYDTKKELLNTVFEEHPVGPDGWLPALLRAASDAAELLELSDEDFVAMARDMYASRRERVKARMRIC